MTTTAEIVVQLAVERGLVSATQLAAARLACERPASETPAANVAEALVAAGVVSERALARLLADAFGFELRDLGAIRPAADALRLLDPALARRCAVLPLLLEETGLVVAAADPLDLDLLDAVAHAVGRPVRAVLALRSELTAALAQAYGPTSDEVVRAPAARPSAPVTEEDDAPVVAWVAGLITRAAGQRASDIHLEPLPHRLRVRLRIDGALVETDGPPAERARAVVSRIKLMAGLSIAERRVPQDGRMQVPVGGRTFDLRVASLPTVRGESLVLRLLEAEQTRVELGSLGWSEADRLAFARLLNRPDGLILVTGPTGSGKTTTLYSCVNYLNQPGRKIITVEDPIEYQLSGVNQVPVRPDVGMTFDRALRAMLRQSPNVILVGEIRDAETAEVALQAALTGHLVLATLHTNDAPGAITRLLDLGLKPFLVAAALRAVVAQRLARRRCESCGGDGRGNASQPRTAGQGAVIGTGLTSGPSARCVTCLGTGFHGRIGLFEFFEMDATVRELIHERASPSRLRAAARARGSRSLREDGLRQVAAGVTTMAEVFAVTVDDTSSPASTRESHEL